MKTEFERALGISPNDRGFGYVVLEGPTRLVDWKVKRVPRPKNQKTIEALDELLGLYMPSYLILDAPDDLASPRGHRIKGLLRDLANCAADRGVIPVPVPRQVVADLFEPMEASTRREVAELLTVQFPELLPYLPPRRRLWDSESRAMSVFNAAAMVLAFYDRGFG